MACTDFRWFFARLAFGALGFFVAVALYRISDDAYFFRYWWSDTVDSVLVFGTLYELFTYMFRAISKKANVGAVLFRWALGISFFVAVVLAKLVPENQPGHLLALLMLLQRTAATITTHNHL